MSRSTSTPTPRNNARCGRDAAHEYHVDSMKRTDDSCARNSCQQSLGGTVDTELTSRCSWIHTGPSVKFIPPRNVHVGKRVGRGGFCSVYEVKSIHNSSTLERQHEGRRNSKTCCHKTGLVVKSLSSETRRNRRLCKIGASDLEFEARLLASLNHPNIIKLRGVSMDDYYLEKDHPDEGFFLLLDRLDKTLDKQIMEWRTYSRKRLTWHKMPLTIKKKRKAFLCKRLRVALDIASALQYLHQHGIIYRDLKPGNIGFHPNGNVQLFDFGLAKQLDRGSTETDEMYEMSGNTGSLWFMSPEVALDRPYNVKADVYSFGLLLWEVMALSVPYEELENAEAHMKHAMAGTYRPPVDPNWPLAIQGLIRQCWDRNPLTRPTMKECSQVLQSEIQRLQNHGNKKGLKKTPSITLGSPARVNAMAA